MTPLPFIVVFVLLIPVLGWLIRREERRRYLRSPEHRAFVEAVERLQVTIGAELLPVMAKLARSARKASEAFADFGKVLANDR